MSIHLLGLEKKYKKKITNVTFRGGEYNCQYVAYSGDEIIYRKGQFEDEYFFGFMAHTLYQPVCHRCPFAEARRISDITLADFQGLTQEIFVKAEGKGESLVLTHTENGQEFFDQIKDRLVFFERPFEEALKENTTLKEPTETHEERERLWKLIYKIGFDKAIHKVYWKQYANFYARKVVGKYWRLLPKTARAKIKKILRRG
ncbi:Coenzyme F420 hydrogenase/dehydrogenase, beta subunit C-terminal domain [uncultured Treponema sp.]|uniref:Coenzyme F420 hydrogenase/dehydrogenase, beta subunit C-terminal domain n=1 Tax=uncultured Treponema sp. TaxID=162155 RepID=UPI0025D1BA1F|nr:Coenzyme F420 hydrogenase/dehydrogenase, beta subunit C-terminal domain [uncultured Treponema sp.]